MRLAAPHTSTLLLLVAGRVVPSLAFPVLAGWLVKVFSRE